MTHHERRWLLRVAVERSYARLRQADSIGPDTGMEAVLGQMLEAHAFLVSADLAWDALKELRKKLLVPAIQAATARHASTRETLAKARNHIEHVTERIREGRTAKQGGEMPKEVFRRSLGFIAGTSVTFGDESFDLAEQRAALVDVENTVGPDLVAAMTLQVTVRVTSGAT